MEGDHTNDKTEYSPESSSPDSGQQNPGASVLDEHILATLAFNAQTSGVPVFGTLASSAQTSGVPVFGTLASSAQTSGVPVFGTLASSAQTVSKLKSSLKRQRDSTIPSGDNERCDSTIPSSKHGRRVTINDPLNKGDGPKESLLLWSYLAKHMVSVGISKSTEVAKYLAANGFDQFDYRLVVEVYNIAKDKVQLLKTNPELESVSLIVGGKERITRILLPFIEDLLTVLNCYISEVSWHRLIQHCVSIDTMTTVQDIYSCLEAIGLSSFQGVELDNLSKFTRELVMRLIILDNDIDSVNVTTVVGNSTTDVIRYGRGSLPKISQIVVLLNRCIAENIWCMLVEHHLRVSSMTTTDQINAYFNKIGWLFPCINVIMLLRDLAKDLVSRLSVIKGDTDADSVHLLASSTTCHKVKRCGLENIKQLTLMLNECIVERAWFHLVEHCLSSGVLESSNKMIDYFASVNLTSFHGGELLKLCDKARELATNLNKLESDDPDIPLATNGTCVKLGRQQLPIIQNMADMLDECFVKCVWTPLVEYYLTVNVAETTGEMFNDIGCTKLSFFDAWELAKLRFLARELDGKLRVLEDDVADVPLLSFCDGSVRIRRCQLPNIGHLIVALEAQLDKI
jgi:hypothetical protein